MLTLVIIFLATLLIAVLTIWLYRAISGWTGGQVAEHGATLGVKKSYISRLTAPPEQKARPVRLRNSTASISAPWGW